MSGPGERRRKEGKQVVARDGEGLEDVLAGPDVVAGVGVVQEPLAGGKGEVEKNRYEEDVGDGGDKER